MHRIAAIAVPSLMAAALLAATAAASSALAAGDREAILAKHRNRLAQAAEAVSLVSLGACRSLAEADAWEATAFKPLADDGLSDEEIEDAAADAIRDVGAKMVARLDAEGPDKVCGEVLAKYGPKGNALPGIVLTR